MQSSIKEKIFQRLQDVKRITNKELADHYDLSLPTIRKLTNSLIQENKAEHVYGGIKLKDSTPLKEEHLTDYHMIAQEAVKLVQDGDSIFLGPGKTVATMCHYLKNKKELVIFTNSLRVINFFKDTSDITIIIIGGLYQHTNQCFSIIESDMLPNISVSKIFISGSGVDPSKGIYHNIPSNRHTEEIFAKLAQQVILLVDKSKFGKNKPFVLMPIKYIDTIITTSDIDPQILEILTQQNISILLGKNTDEYEI